MKIIDVHKFNTKLKLLTEWNNFKHRIAKYVSEIIKKLSEKIKNDDDNLKNDTVMISIQKYFLNHRLKNKNALLKFLVDDSQSSELFLNKGESKNCGRQPRSLNQGIGDYPRFKRLFQ